MYFYLLAANGHGATAVGDSFLLIFSGTTDSSLLTAGEFARFCRQEARWISFYSFFLEFQNPYCSSAGLAAVAAPDIAQSFSDVRFSGRELKEPLQLTDRACDVPDVRKACTTCAMLGAVSFY